MLKQKIIKENYKLTLEENNMIFLYFFHNNFWEKIGSLIFEFTNYILMGEKNDYCNLINMHIDEKHQNKNFGHAMFEYLLENLSENTYAVICNREKILNKIQVPKIFRKNNSFNVGNFELILNKNFKNFNK